MDSTHDVIVCQVNSARPLVLEDIICMVPEISSTFAADTNFQQKAVVFVQEHIRYETPYREGNIRIKPPGRSCRQPHVAFCDDSEQKEFLKFGSAPLVIVIKHGGVWNGMETEMPLLAKAMASERVIKLLVITDNTTPPADWRAAYDAFARHGKTIAYKGVSI